MKIELVDIDRVTPYEKNAKKHPPEQVKQIVAAIKAAKGWDQPIVVDRNFVIIKGHGRRLAAIAMGIKQVPVYVRDDLSDEEVRAARLSDNRVAQSDYDTGLLRIELEDLNLDLLKGIFDDKELEFSTMDLGSMNTDAFITDLDKAVEANDAATAAKVEERKAADVQVWKALGFRSIPGADEIHVSRFMAEIEKQTGLKGSEAFVSFVKALLGQVSQ